jgi:DNA adenine methylase
MAAVPTRRPRAVARSSSARVFQDPVRSARGHSAEADPPKAKGGCRPFLRWAGGKRWLIPHLPNCFPAQPFGTYHEPFLGSASVFFATRPSRARLSDINKELINAFEVVKSDPEGLISTLGDYASGSRRYYRVRDHTRPRTPIARAAKFLYLNKTCWNGLYRVNRKFKFNVPYGWTAKTLTFDLERIRGASIALRGVSIDALEFDKALERVDGGDFVFADPPYVVGETGNGFLAYHSGLFVWAKQEQLKIALDKIHSKGAQFLLTNADHPAIRALYAEYHQKAVSRTSSIAADPKNRGQVRELLISNYPLRESANQPPG